jgi:hypothetical protein
LEKVDEALLREIEHWRIELAGDLARRNPELSQRKLNLAVQKTIDRLLFLRICEARGMEPYGRLQALQDGPKTYARLGELFRDADDRYNSGLFHFTLEKDRSETPDGWTLTLDIEDRVLKDILCRLYDSESPFEFSELSADILGQVYERFLGRVIRLTEGHRAVVEDKPEVKKAGGVYYTPASIVDYIVQQTVGRLLDGKTPYEAAARTPTWRPSKRGRPLTILDPACGSGSFLIGAYQYLLDWYRNWYVGHDPDRHKDRVSLAREGQWRLTTAERKRILLDHVYGVDLDPQAVEVTKLSLLLKVLEGENEQTRPRQPGLFRERALPDLASNIQCGNSLIGSDFYENRPGSPPDDDARLRINAFDWEAAFSPVIATGGFDVVIGNPPYLNVRLVTQTLGESVKQYFRRKYSCARRGYDLYVLFVERAFHLLRDRGRGGMIVPNKIATLDYAAVCRKLLLDRTTLAEIVDVSQSKAFSAAGVYPYIIIWENAVPPRGHRIDAKHVRAPEELLRANPRGSRMLQADLTAETGLSIHGSLHVETRVSTEPLGRRATLHSGTTGFAAQRMANSLKEEADAGRAEGFDFIVSGNIDRYAISLGNVRFMNRMYARPRLDADKGHLTDNKRRLYAGAKIVLAGMARRLEAAYDRGGLALGVQVYAAADMAEDPRYLLGLLNSKLLSYLFRIRFQAKHLAGGFLAINKGQLARLPIRTLDTTNPAECQQHDRLVRLVDRMLSLVNRQRQTKAAGEDSALQRQIDATDRHIDQLVYELYELTDEEIHIVEGSMATL